MNWFKWMLANNAHRPRARAAKNDVAYAYWSCLEDGESCARCKEHGDQMWIPGMANPSRPPLRSCTSSGGCRCEIVLVMQSDADAASTVDFIRRNGGKALRSDFDGAADNPKVRAREARSRQESAGETIRRAQSCEREEPERAIELYREGIAAYKDIAPQADRWMWRDFPYCYNRLTMVLEQMRRDDEALRAIDDFYGLPWPTYPTKADAEAIAKRLRRLRVRSQAKSTAAHAPD